MRRTLLPWTVIGMIPLFILLSSLSASGPTGAYRVLQVSTITSTDFDYLPLVENNWAPPPTPTPVELPQVYFGILAQALRLDSCGDAVFISQDHDPQEGVALSFWDRYPDVPKPAYPYRTKDQRRNMDICTWPGFPITFLQEEGRVTQNRLKNGVPQDAVIDILITEGVGAGLTLGFGHVDSDTDPNTPGIQYLPVGTIVHQGDVVCHTGEGPVPELGTPTNIGLLDEELGDYHPDQEMMYIGPDGEPNILY